MTNIFIGNLSYQTTASDLEGAVAGFGQVTRATVICDRETGRLSKIQSTRSELQAVRLTVSDGQMRCHQGRQKSRDHAFERVGRPTLLMTPPIPRALSRQTLDAPQTKRDRRLRIVKPINEPTKQENID